MENKTFAGIDLGGTHLRGGLVTDNDLHGIISQRIDGINDFDTFLKTLFSFLDSLLQQPVHALGIGVPGLVENGHVFDVVNIPSWKEINLKNILEERYQIPVQIDNDANCFALGESVYGKGKGHQSMIGLTIGTGLGTGIIINKKIYSGKNSGAGEIGMIDYLDHFFEYYASGQFFQNVYSIDGEIVFNRAQEGDSGAIKMYDEMGTHLGKAIKVILLAYDPGLIVLGGSVSKAYPFFQQAMWQEIQNFPFKRIIGQLQIEVSQLEHSGILGAAALNNQSSSVE